MERILNIYKRNQDKRLIQLQGIQSKSIHKKENYKKKLPFCNTLGTIFMLIPIRLI